MPWWLGLIHIAAFFAKIICFMLFFIWVRWTLPRFRYDQLMKLGWVVFFEIALVNIFITAGIMILFKKLMAIVVKRPKLSLLEKMYLPAVVKGLRITPRARDPHPRAARTR